MSPGMWFVVLVFGLAVLGACSGAGFGGFMAGLIGGFTLWCLGGLWWLVSSSYDCVDDRDTYGVYSSEAQESCA